MKEAGVAGDGNELLGLDENGNVLVTTDGETVALDVMEALGHLWNKREASP